MAKEEIYVFYGSQTGQAESIAELIHEAAEEHGLSSTLMCLWKAQESFRIISEGVIPAVFVCSTTGDGELPATARKFMRILARKTHPEGHLSRLRYALLGLGDTNYSTFCGGPKTLEKGLKNLGAVSFYPTGYADDGTDMEIVVEPWIEGLWLALKSHIQHRILEREDPTEHHECSAEQTTQAIENISKDLAQTSLNCQIGDGLNTEAIGISHSSSESSKTAETNNGFEVLQDDKTTAIDHENDTKVVAELGIEPKMNFDTSEGQLEVKSETLLFDLANKTEGTLPPLMQSYLTYEFCGQDIATEPLSPIPSVPYPIAANEEFYSAKIRSVEKLTADNAVKSAFCVNLELPDAFLYEPGDSFGVFIQNPKEEIDWLIKRLKVESDCDKTIELNLDPNSKKKNAKLPNFIPKIASIRYIFQNCLEIRSVPKRTFLRALFEYTSVEADRNILRQLCRKESMEDFAKYVREPNLNILDILAALPSCQPPFEVLIEHLPRLKARLYSAASCLVVHPSEVRFVFNVLNFESTDGRMYARNGLSTGYLSSLAGNLPNKVADNSPVPTILPIFKTKNVSFRLLENLDSPIVMVGPGTGVAPFIGFLESLRFRKSKGDLCPETWLFYGGRHKERDFLFEKELNAFVADGTLSHLVVAFSRDITPQGSASELMPKYVQDNIRLRSHEVLEMLLRRNATFYVCGDARNMAKDVRETIIEILSQEMAKDVALETLKTMVKNGRYKEDVWT